MSFTNSLLMIGLLCVGISTATTAQAGNQLFEGSWSVKAFGNEISGGTGDEEFYSAIGIPLGIQCNPNQPRCPFESTPTDGSDNFHPLGGTLYGTPYCAPWYNWGGYGATARPSNGTSYSCSIGCPNPPIPPFYRNPNFFTSAGQPRTTFCTAKSTTGMGGKGLLQAGQPVAGIWSAKTNGAQLGGFTFAAAPENHKSGVRTTGQIGEFPVAYPYLYRYTYATLRNDQGVFSPGGGPGNFNLLFFKQGVDQVASIKVTQGAAKFGGTMRMLGALTSKVCYYRAGGCSLGENNWRYDAVGASAMTAKGVVTEGYIATYKAYYYHTALMQQSTANVYGSRFPWTTGSVTVTATGRGPHKTVHYAQGYDNRNTAPPSGKGTIQLVTPVLTRWLRPCCKFKTGGVGILRIKFVPEPQTWAMLAAGVSLLGVGYRMRGR